jgi:hypothetical protein
VNVAAGQTATADVTLTQAALSLAAVVTTVTGEQKKAEISNTVATLNVVGPDRRDAGVDARPGALGRAAGVQVVSGGARPAPARASASAASRRCRWPTSRSSTSTACA